MRLDEKYYHGDLLNLYFKLKIHKSFNVFNSIINVLFWCRNVKRKTRKRIRELKDKCRNEFNYHLIYTVSVCAIQYFVYYTIQIWGFMPYLSINSFYTIPIWDFTLTCSNMPPQDDDLFEHTNLGIWILIWTIYGTNC